MPTPCPFVPAKTVVKDEAAVATQSTCVCGKPVEANVGVALPMFAERNTPPPVPFTDTNAIAVGDVPPPNAMPVPTPVPNVADCVQLAPDITPRNTTALAPLEDAPSGPTPAIATQPLITAPGDPVVAAQLVPLFAVVCTVPF